MRWRDERRCCRLPTHIFDAKLSDHAALLLGVSVPIIKDPARQYFAMTGFGVVGASGDIENVNQTL
jgi:hypothetical protein